MPEVKWVKVATDMFERNRKIKQIEMKSDGDTILVIWLKLMLLAGTINDGGAIYVTPDIPYEIDELAGELRRPVEVVEKALSIFKRYDMISIDRGVIYLNSWEKYQNAEKLAEIREYNRIAQRRSRERRRSQSEKESVNDNVIDETLTCQPCHDTEKEEEKEEEFHSFIHAPAAEEIKRKFVGGTLGQGVVMLSDAEMDDLLNKLSIEEFDRYVGIVAEMELSGRKYKKRTHYQAILDMAMHDRKIK